MDGDFILPMTFGDSYAEFEADKLGFVDTPVHEDKTQTGTAVSMTKHDILAIVFISIQNVFLHYIVVKNVRVITQISSFTRTSNR